MFLWRARRGITSTDWNQRLEAARRLGESAHPLAVEPLAELLGDPTPAVRRTAARALGRLREPAGVSPLIEALCDESTEVSVEAFEQLEDLDPEWRASEKGQGVAARMLALLASTDLEKRETAASVLVKTGRLQDVDRLLTALQDACEASQDDWLTREGKHRVRRDIVAALARLADLEEDGDLGSLPSLLDSSSLAPFVSSLLDDAIAGSPGDFKAVWKSMRSDIACVCEVRWVLSGARDRWQEAQSQADQFSRPTDEDYFGRDMFEREAEKELDRAVARLARLGAEARRPLEAILIDQSEDNRLQVEPGWRQLEQKIARKALDGLRRD